MHAAVVGARPLIIDAAHASHARRPVQDASISGRIVECKQVTYIELIFIVSRAVVVITSLHVLSLTIVLPSTVL